MSDVLHPVRPDGPLTGNRRVQRRQARRGHDVTQPNGDIRPDQVVHADRISQLRIGAHQGIDLAQVRVLVEPGYHSPAANQPLPVRFRRSAR